MCHGQKVLTDTEQAVIYSERAVSIFFLRLRTTVVQILIKDVGSMEALPTICVRCLYFLFVGDLLADYFISVVIITFELTMYLLDIVILPWVVSTGRI